MLAQQYVISYTETTEIRSRIVTVIYGEYDDQGGYVWDDDENDYIWEEYLVWEEWDEDVLVVYEWTILYIYLDKVEMEDIFRSMFYNTEQEEHFDAFLEQGHGNRQLMGSPFDFRWRNDVSSLFGWRIHPISGSVSMHRGLDIAMPTGTPVQAAHTGIVTRAEYEAGGYGHWIEIREVIESTLWFAPNTVLITRYAHLNERLVSVGQEVTEGDIIGLVGSTGSSTGPHLHFEVITATLILDTVTINTVHLNPLVFAWIGDE